MPIGASAAACTLSWSSVHAAWDTATAISAAAPTAHRKMERIASSCRNAPALTGLPNRVIRRVPTCRVSAREQPRAENGAAADALRKRPATGLLMCVCGTLYTAPPEGSNGDGGRWLDRAAQQSG